MISSSMRNLYPELSKGRGPASAATAGDARAFRALVLEHAPDLLRMLRSLGVRSADLDDVCQETFIVVHRCLPSFEGRSSLRTWLFGIALRVASTYRNKAYRRRERPADVTPEIVSPASQEGALHAKEAWLMMERLLETLSEERREIFVLYEIAQMSVPEIAALLGWPVQTAYSRLHAARAQVERGIAALRRRELAR